MTKLTKTLVERLRPHAECDKFVWDSALPGFGLRVYPSGKRKYVVQYRTKDNRQRRVGIGQHGVLTAEGARIKARDILADVSKGKDPAAEKRAAREAPTVRDLADDYLERHAIPNKRPASVDDDRAMLNRLVLPKLGSTKVATVSRPDIEKLHNKLRSTPYAANRLLALLSKMFNLAVAWGWRVTSPVKGIPRLHEDRRERWLSRDELNRLWSVLDEHPNQRAASAVKLLILTGAQRSIQRNVGAVRPEAWRLDEAKPSHEAEAHGVRAIEQRGACPHFNTAYQCTPGLSFSLPW